jgi:hypothetical protein
LFHADLGGGATPHAGGLRRDGYGAPRPLRVLRGSLRKHLKQRLLYGAYFQGARHELRVAAVCVAAGFDLKFEDESDGSRKHPEFVGKHRTLGYEIAVEAKSRHRFGVNGFTGGKEGAPEDSVGIRDLVLGAYKKASSVPFYVFVDAL